MSERSSGGLFLDSKRRALTVLGCLTVLGTAVLPFIGLGLNDQAEIFGSAAAPPAPATVARCLDAVAGHSLFSYTGVALVAGGAPLSEPAPSVCATVPGVAITQAGAEHLRTTPLVAAILAAVTIVIAIVGALSAGRRAPLVVAASAFAALLMLVIANAEAASSVFNTAASAGGATSVPYLMVTPGIGYVAAIFATALVAVFNLAALVMARFHGIVGLAPQPG